MKLSLTASLMRINIYHFDLDQLNEYFDDETLKNIDKYSELDDKGNFVDRRSSDLYEKLLRIRKIIPIELSYDDRTRKYMIVDGHHRIAVLKTKFENREFPAVVYSSACPIQYGNERLTSKSEFDGDTKLNFSNRINKILALLK